MAIKWNKLSIFTNQSNKLYVPQCWKYSTKRVNVRNNFRFEKEFNQKLGDQNRLVSASLIDDSVGFANNAPRPKRMRKHAEIKYGGEILFGIHPVYLSLLERRRKFHCLFVRKTLTSDTENSTKRLKIIELAKLMHLPIQSIDNNGLKYLASDSLHQGICLDASPLPVLAWTEDKLEHKVSEKSLLIILNEILDPMNVGAIMRSAHYFGAKEIFITKRNSCKLSPIVSKASSGCLEVLDIYQIENLEDFLKERKMDGYHVISTKAYCETKNCHQPTIDLKSITNTGRNILILGNEGKGISPSIQSLCDAFISIKPRHKLQEGIDSLNVSVAAGIILYTLSRKLD